MSSHTMTNEHILYFPIKSISPLSLMAAQGMICIRVSALYFILHNCTKVTEGWPTCHLNRQSNQCWLRTYCVPCHRGCEDGHSELLAQEDRGRPVAPVWLGDLVVPFPDAQKHGSNFPYFQILRSNVRPFVREGRRSEWANFQEAAVSPVNLNAWAFMSCLSKISRKNRSVSTHTGLAEKLYYRGHFIFCTQDKKILSEINPKVFFLFF